MKQGLSNITTQEDLRRAIEALEQSRAEALQTLEGQSRELVERLKPVNILKGALQDIGASADVKGRLWAIGVGMAAGHIARFLYQGKSPSPARQFVGSMLQVGITTYVTGKPEAVQRVGEKAIRAIRLATEDAAETR